MKGADVAKGNTAKPIFDADLAARLENLHGEFREVMYRNLLAIQEKRDAAKALSPTRLRSNSLLHQSPPVTRDAS